MHQLMQDNGRGETGGKLMGKRKYPRSVSIFADAASSYYSRFL
ncbi:hypothetical protein [Sporolactobacillus vineae]|nr:hypothetical protein [Sporolactobacillus vineae]